MPQRIPIFLACLTSTILSGSLIADEPSDKVLTFLKTNCLDCHEGKSAEAGFDLTKLPKEFSKTDVDKWTRIFDRVHDNEMPPKEYGTLESADKNEFLKLAGKWLKQEQHATYKKLGRVRGRRLTNVQLERTLHDLLGVDIPLASLMPVEPKVNGFTTVADGQPMSHFQLEQHLTVVDAALDEAFRRAMNNQPDETKTTLSATQLSRSNKNRRCRDPELIDELAVTWTGKLPFYGRMPATRAKEPGWYRMTVRAKAINPPINGSVWCTIRVGECISTAPLLNWAGAFEATDTLEEHTVQIWVPEDHGFVIRPGDVNLKKGKFRGGQVGTGEGSKQDISGVGIEWIKLDLIHLGPDDDEIRRLLFGSIGFKEASKAPRKYATQLMRQFARRAFRRPIDGEIIKPFVKIVYASINEGKSFDQALQRGYRALLCSSRFLYLNESPGRLDDYALASRLSYLLWNRMPDHRLMQLADAGKLQDDNVLRGQVARLLKHENAKYFVTDFAAQWLDLNLIDFTEPDRKLYPGFDTIVQYSMLDETHKFLQAMLDQNLSVKHLIDSDFTFLNSRLAKYYGIAGVDGDEMRKVSLSNDPHRGGLITQGAILKVTANGTTTSPVIRGVWISERLLGEEIPPPPENVSAIEPDIRGAKTIREQLAKHINDPSCSSCHVKMDPPGFALENFDPSGRWRENYIKLKGRKRLPGAKVDPKSELVDGGPFKNIHEFQSLVVKDKQNLANNVAAKLMTYGTGAPVHFADRDDIQKCVESAKQHNYGFRSLIHAVVQSETFRSK